MAGQIRSYEEDRKAKSQDVLYTTSAGAPVAHPYEYQRAGQGGPLLLQDHHLIDSLAHFDRERIPERVVHAKGGGAHGTYKTTAGIEDLCVADIFKTGKECPITARFSTVGGESGSHDCARDPRGFSVKFRTTEGNWDCVYNNTPVFFLRDPTKFVPFIHTQKRHPATHLTHADDSTLFWEYFSQNPEAVHQVMILMGDRGIPRGWRSINGYAGHTHKLINSEGVMTYVQFHWKAQQPRDFITQEDSASYSPDFSTKDLNDAIERGDFPKWDLCIQTMTPKQAEDAWQNEKINIFDLTHVWPQKAYPLRKVGEFTLNEAVTNYFSEIESVAFSPSHLIPGIEASADPVLQSRLFSYPDTHRYRLGTNYLHLPINQPTQLAYKMGNFQRDGAMSFYSQGARPNFFSMQEPVQLTKRVVNWDETHGHFVGTAVTALSEIRPEDFNAPRALYEKVFDDAARERLVNNISGHIKNCSEEEIIKRQIAIFREVSEDFASRLEKAIGVKGYDGISGMTFNGSHNGMAKSDSNRTAAGMPIKDAVGLGNNNGPLPGQHRQVAAAA